MLTTVKRVKGSIALDLPEDADALIERLILEATGVAEDYCNRNFHWAEYTEVFDGTGRDKIRLRGLPVWKMVSITVDGEEIALSDVMVNSRAGEIYYPAGFAAGYQNVQVGYEAGYFREEEPEEGEENGEEEPEYDRTPPEELEGAIIAEVVSRYENYTTETRMGENLVDLRTNFLTSRSRDYFSRQRFPNV